MAKTNMPTESDFVAPEHLSDRAKRLWSCVVPDRARSIGRLAMIRVALEALDRADLAREEIKTAGMTSKTETTGAIHIHPLVRVERESRQQFSRIWGDQLSLAYDGSIDGCDLPHFLARMERANNS